jgi:anaerobic ribonucleoside-triphosphate reductase activating protein
MIRTDDMLNGNGLRVVLFCTACDHYCKNCHNQETWQASNGTHFDDDAKKTIYKELEKDYIDGLTLSGGDPLNKNNLDDVLDLCKEIKTQYPNKTIWLYSGYLYEQIDTNIDTDENMYWQKRRDILYLCDVLVDGKFQEELADVKYPWAGSTNQRVIDIKKSLEQDEVVLWCD